MVLVYMPQPIVCWRYFEWTFYLFERIFFRQAHKRVKEVRGRETRQRNYVVECLEQP